MVHVQEEFNDVEVARWTNFHGIVISLGFSEPYHFSILSNSVDSNSLWLRSFSIHVAFRSWAQQKKKNNIPGDSDKKFIHNFKLHRIVYPTPYLLCIIYYIIDMLAVAVYLFVVFFSSLFLVTFIYTTSCTCLLSNVHFVCFSVACFPSRYTHTYYISVER